MIQWATSSNKEDMMKRELFFFLVIGLGIGMFLDSG